MTIHFRVSILARSVSGLSFLHSETAIIRTLISFVDLRIVMCATLCYIPFKLPNWITSLLWVHLGESELRETNSCVSFVVCLTTLSSSIVFVIPHRSTLVCCFCGCRDLQHIYNHLQEHYTRLYLCKSLRRGETLVFVQVLSVTGLTGHSNRSDRFVVLFSVLSLGPVWPVCLTSLTGQYADSWFNFCTLQNLLKCLFTTPPLGDIRGPFNFV